ncbi:single-stranded DNA-binding protein [Lactococcus fujiensis]|uniref:single-stranded DNA-binding protein n=1 Tax=Lactococcus fujiensis TaxID=610251 RepID=UPI000BDF2ECB|nr:single-stranded DNA-binding protein [Lactococcus fujiensis]
MNKTVLIGRIVAAPELSHTSNNKNFIRNTLAVNRRFKNENGERMTDFISIVIWGKLAENFVSYAQKGTMISIEGEIRTRQYIDQQDKKHYVTEVLVSSYEILESRSTIALRKNNRNTEELILEGEELPF